MTDQNKFEEVIINDDDTPFRKLCRSRWSALIRKVHEVNPLCFPDRGGEMSKMRRGGKYIAFIEKKDQADIIDKIFKHCNLWTSKPFSDETLFSKKGSPKVRGTPGVPSDEDVDFPPRRIYDILEPEYLCGDPHNIYL